jgi:FkbM family methyltransferase
MAFLRILINIARRNRIHHPELKTDKLLLGSLYGGHTVAVNSLPEHGVCYSFGIGEDVSFDLAYIQRSGGEVFAYDPTPRSKDFVEKHATDARFHFKPVGISKLDGVVDVVEPENPAHVSFSMANGRAPTATFDVRRLATLMEENGHRTVDILKLDIEGFEYEVLQDILTCGIRPKQILVEYHHNMFGIPAKNTKDSVNLLRSNGYKLFHVSDSGREYSFLLT